MSILEMTWQAVPPSVASARHAVGDHLRAAATSDPPASDIALAVSEAVTNAVVHGHPSGHGQFRVRVEVGPHEIGLLVEDNGTGMTPRPDSPGVGLGLPLIAQLSRRFEISERDGGGTQVCIWFDTNPEAATMPR